MNSLAQFYRTYKAPINLVIFGVAAYFAVRGLIRLIETLRAESLADQSIGAGGVPATTNLTPAQATYFAQQIRAAFDPLGLGVNIGGTDEEYLYQLGREITNRRIDDVARAYRQQYNDDLSSRLIQELTTTELQTWNQALAGL